MSSEKPISNGSSYGQRLVSFLKETRLSRLARLLILGGDIDFTDSFRLNYARPFVSRQITFQHRSLQIADPNSFLATYEEIFLRKIYQLNLSTDSPLMIDGGANIGLATLFFKQSYVKGRVIAFEPDPTVFQMLESNISSFRLQDVNAIRAAISAADGTSSFISQGGTSGHLGSNALSPNVTVRTVRLKSFLHQKVDFLKLDIEGSEGEVFDDIQDELCNVNHLFVEYHSYTTSKQKLNVILHALTSAGFRYHIKESFSAARPFVDHPRIDDMDMSLNIFASRTRND